MLFDHLALCVTMMISAVVCPIVFDTFQILIFKGDARFCWQEIGFLNHGSMKPALICQPISKFSMFTFAISHTMPFIVRFP